MKGRQGGGHRGGVKAPSDGRSGPAGRPGAGDRRGATGTAKALSGAARPAVSAPRPARATRGDAIAVNGHSDRWLSQGFPWVYPNEVEAGAVAPAGREVVLLGPQGAARGRGLTDTGWIAVRRFREDDGALDAAWMRDVVAKAASRRLGVVGGDTTAWRRLHAENDGLPGIRVDGWGRHRSVILDTPSVGALLPLLVDALVAEGEVDAIWLSYRLDARDREVEIGSLRPAPGLLWGEGAREEVLVREDGMTMAVRPWEGPDVGMYLDMRDVRRWLAPRWAGMSVLNLFAYTGAFSVAARRGGARSTVTVDLSRPNLDRARENFRHNGFDPDAEGWACEDAFKALDRFRRQGARFDRVIVDPPSFSHGPVGTWSARQDLPRLVAASAAVTAPGGWLVIASNQGQVAPREFRGQVAQGLAKAGRTGVELAWFSAAPDFPARTTFPEGHYLKVGVWAVDP